MYKFFRFFHGLVVVVIILWGAWICMDWALKGRIDRWTAKHDNIS